MRFTVKNMQKINHRYRKKFIKKAIREIKDQVKKAARKYNSVTIEFYEKFSNDEQKIISDYFTKRNFEVEWCSDSEIEVRWV